MPVPASRYDLDNRRVLELPCQHEIAGDASGD
jgi:hypothetical protein